MHFSSACALFEVLSKLVCAELAWPIWAWCPKPSWLLGTPFGAKPYKGRRWLRKWISELQAHMPKDVREELAERAEGFQMVCKYEDWSGRTRVPGA